MAYIGIDPNSGVVATADGLTDVNTTGKTQGNTLVYDSDTSNFIVGDHDNLSGFVANEHIDHTTVSVTAGSGLTGGGTIAATRTLNIGAGTGVTVNADDVAIGQDVATTADVTFATVETTGNVVVGGNLTVNGTTTTINSTELAVDDLNITVASGAADSASANGAGITVDGANATIKYTSATDTWDLNKSLGTTTNVISNYTTTELSEGDNLYYTTVRVDSDIDAAFVAKSTGDLSEGSNLYYTTARADSDARHAISASGDLSYDPNTGVMQFDVESVYTKANFDSDLGLALDTDAVTTTDLTEGNNLYYTTARADSDAKNSLVAGTGVTYTAATGTIASNDSEIVHDNLSGFVANEHIDHSTVSVTAGSGLTGGGTIAATRTINIGQGTGITVSADAIATNDAEIVHDNLSGFIADEHVAHSAVSVTAGAGLTGGGDITQTRTLNIGAGTGITVNADDVAISNTAVTPGTYASSSEVAQVTVNQQGQITGATDVAIDHDALTNFVSDEHIAHSGVTLTAGSGLTGGGTIAASRTFNIGEGTGITVSADAIATNDAEIVHDNLSGFVSDEHIAHSGVTLTAGAGLTGGGTIAASRTFTVGAGTGVTVNADDVAIGQDVATTADVTFNSLTTTDGLIVGGDLQVTGTTTTVNSASLEVTDNMIYMNAGESDGSPTQSIDVGWAANVNDGGSYTHVGMFRDATDDRFKVFGAYTPEPDAAVEINTGHASFALADFQADTFYGALSGNATTATTLQTARTIGGISFNGSANINLPGVNTAGNQDTSGNASTATALETGRTIGLSGDVTATGVSFDGTGNITLTTAMAANSVDLTTHTTGNYVADGATSGNGISGSVSSEGGTFTVSSNATNANTPSTIVYRDASGNFSAGTITAALSGNATTATTLATARDIGGVSFNGSANINLPGVNATGNQDTSGNAATATALATGRTIGLSGDVTAGGVSFDGTGNITLTTALAANTVTSSELSGATSLVIYNSAGTALKTLYGAGS